jgi:plasmid maintenance system antidote protein VapI
MYRAFGIDDYGRRRSSWRDALVNEKRGISPEMAVRLSKVFGGTEEGWLVQQAQYDLAQVRRDRIKLKRLEFA